MLYAVYTNVPVAGGQTFRREAPHSTWIILLQETGSSDRNQTRTRWITIRRADGGEYTAWYLRNVMDGLTNVLKVLKIEIHLFPGGKGNPDVARRHESLRQEYREAGKGVQRLASVPYRRIAMTTAKPTMLGGPASGTHQFRDVPLHEIDETTLTACLSSANYEETMGTQEWFPMRQHRRRRGGKGKKRRERKIKRARREGGTPDASLDEGAGHRSASERGETDDEDGGPPEAMEEGGDKDQDIVDANNDGGAIRRDGILGGRLAIWTRGNIGTGTREESSAAGGSGTWTKDVLLGKRRR